MVHGNATKHIEEVIGNQKLRSLTPDKIRLATQQQLRSLQAAVNQATSKGMIYDQLMTVGGWELKFGMPKQAGMSPVLFHALPIQ